MMKQNKPTRVVVIPEDIQLATGKSLSHCRSVIRKWKREEGLTLKQYITVELASKKTGIPVEVFITVMK